MLSLICKSPIVRSTILHKNGQHCACVVKRATSNVGKDVNDLPPEVTIVEVGPRDGLQNEKQILSTDAKVKLVELLCAANLKKVEVASFVSPKWVPQMADSIMVTESLRKPLSSKLMALVPNLRGLETAMSTNIDEIAVFVSASESFSQRNINCTINESFERLKPVCKEASRAGLRIRGYVSCALECPFEGKILPATVARVAEDLLCIGCNEICLADTIGTGTPIATFKMIHAVNIIVPLNQISVHFHDTYGQGLANILASLQYGITIIDGSIAGLGGCPYAPNATGNVATEDIVYMLHGCGVRTGVNMDKLLEASKFISEALGRPPNSKVAKVLLSKC